MNSSASVSDTYLLVGEVEVLLHEANHGVVVGGFALKDGAEETYPVGAFYEGVGEA